MALRTGYRWYIGRDDAKLDYLGIPNAQTAKDSKIDSLIKRASRRIEQLTHRVFIPVTETRYFDYPGNSIRLFLDGDLLSVTTLAVDDDAIASTDYHLYPLNGYPKMWLEMDLAEGEVFTYSDTPQKSVEIAGVWGYTDDYEASGSLLDGAISSATATTIVVDNGADFQIGDCILVDTEAMFVSGISGNDLTVVRGVNGTTAATHDTDSIVYIYKPPADIAHACGVLVARWEKRAETAWSDRTGTAEAGFSIYSEIPTEVKSILNNYRRVVL